MNNYEATNKTTELILPVTENNTGKVLIQTVSGSDTFLYNSYIITSVNGESVVIDPAVMPKKSVVDINPVAILSTHTHYDHVDEEYSKQYNVPGDGNVKTKDFNIYFVEASHFNDTIDNSNTIYVFEVNGLRIAHMGDLGQTVLTEKQLDSLGKIDIAFTQFINFYSEMNLENKKGFHLIEQLNPKVIIQTHSSPEAEKELEEKYGTLKEFDNILEITAEDLPEKTQIYKISNTHKYE